MALIKCLACEKEISAEAASCPSCGHPLVKPEKGGLSAARGVGVAAAGTALGIILAVTIMLWGAIVWIKDAMKPWAPPAIAKVQARAPSPFPPGTTIEYARTHYDGSAEQADWIAKHR
jgi:hypothetical protein